MARFHTRPLKRSGTRRSPLRRWLLSWWNLWRVPTLVTIVAGIWWFAIRPVVDEQEWVQEEAPFSLCGEAERTAGCVIDGDTVLLNRPGQRPARIRLTGFDTPEIDGACPKERKLAQQARSALADWLALGPFEWDGADTPPRDQYGRELRAVRRVAADGSHELLAETMLESGLAAQTGWGSDPRDWCK